MSSRFPSQFASVTFVDDKGVWSCNGCLDVVCCVSPGFVPSALLVCAFAVFGLGDTVYGDNFCNDNELYDPLLPF